MSGASFEKIDYQLRYNKHIERRLIFDLLKRAQNLVNFTAHGYLGFGSMWFADFRLAHRMLELNKMYSMEREDYADRATFNQPFNSITVLGGDCSVTLKSLDAEYWKTPHIAWLDYDGRLTPEVVHDLYLLIDHCSPNSVITVTVNGGWRNYRPALIKKDQVRGRKETSIGQIETLLGANVVPPRFEPGPPNAMGVSQDILESQFSEFLAEALLVALSHRLATSGRHSDGQALHFIPLFNFCHQDGVEMVTVGGAVVKDQDRAIWLEKIRAGVPLNHEGSLPLHQRLDLVPLTLKEKITLDACLPQAHPDFVSTARAHGIKLHDSELGKYWAYHRQFPTFFESPL